MKRKKITKGLTLIEILISLAILSIILIPISNMIAASVNLNTSGESKQKAVTISQQTIEELKALNEIRTSTTLGNGLVINTADGKVDEYTGTRNLDDNYTETVNIKPKQDMLVNNGTSNTVDYDLTIYIDGDDTNLKARFNSPSAAPYNIEVGNLTVGNNASNITVSIGSGSPITFSRKAGSDGKVRVLFKNTLNLTANFNLKASNNMQNPLSVYFETEGNISVNYSLENEEGKIRKFINSVKMASTSNTSRVYEIEVIIIKGSKEIYRNKAYKTMY